jgi:hypothetical protein
MSRIEKSFIAFTDKLLDDGQKDIQMIVEYSKLDQRYMPGQIMRAEIIQGLVSSIICLTQTRDGKKDADLKVIFRLGKEMTAEEWQGLGGIPAGSVSEFQAWHWQTAMSADVRRPASFDISPLHLL